MTLETQNSKLSTHNSRALRELLLALADDEFVTGYSNSEWTGIAPLLEEDLAFSSLATLPRSPVRPRVSSHEKLMRA